jgi:hypothetical protein
MVGIAKSVDPVIGGVFFLILPAMGDFQKVPFVHHFVPFGHCCQVQNG